MKPPSSKQIIGSYCLHMETVDSTNDQALNMLAKSNPIEGTVISADFQTRGRGQRDHFWQSEAGKNLLLSIILYPPGLTAGNQFYLSMFIANAVTSFLQTLLPGERLRIKWPNDIYFDDKKIGGILIQNNLKGERIESSVVGIGLNVNQSHFDKSIPNPTSLHLLTGNVFDLIPLKRQLLNKVDIHYKSLQEGNYELLKTEYEFQLYKKGQLNLITHRHGKVEGVVLGVEKDGRLIINIDGKIKKLFH